MTSKYNALPAKEQARLAELDTIIVAAQNEKQAIKRNTSVPSGTLEAFLDTYLNYIQVQLGFSEHTVVAYRKDCRTFLDIFKLRAWLESFLPAKKPPPTSIRKNCERFLRFLRKDRSFNIDQAPPGEKDIDAFLDILDKAGRKKDQKLLVKEELSDFLDEVKKNGLDKQIKRTRKVLEALVKKTFCDTQQLPIEDDISDFISELSKDGLADSSIQRSLSALRTFLKFLVRKELLAEDPSREIETPRKGKYLPYVLEEEAVTRLLDAVVEHPSRYPMRDRALLELLYASGLRNSEACDLLVQDLRLDLGIIKCTGKGSKERIVPTSRTCMEAIDAYRQRERPALLNGRDTELLFLSRSGRKLGREVVAAMIRKYSLLAGLPGRITPHTLRHSFATHLLRGGANLRIVQEILGHVNVETTEKYTHIEKSELKKLHTEFHPRG